MLITHDQTVTGLPSYIYMPGPLDCRRQSLLLNQPIASEDDVDVMLKE